MYVTLPDADAMRLVKKQFAELWKKVETEIDTALCRNPDYGEHINAVREIALGVKCHVEDIHIARTAPVVGDPRREWRSMRFMSELSPLELQELVARNSGSKIPELAPATYEQETEPWRSTSAWQLENHINPALFRSNCDLSKCRDDPYLMALFAVHDGKEDEVVFGGKPYACNSWVRLLVDLSMDHLAIIQQSFAVREHVQISTEDYDAINAAFDAIPGFNYAALVENEASGVTSHPTSDLQEPTSDFRAAGDTLAAVKSESDVGLTAYDREIIEAVIRRLDAFPKRQLNLIYSEETEGRSFIPAMAFPFRFVCPGVQLGQGGIGLFVDPCSHFATGCTIELGDTAEERIAEDSVVLKELFSSLASVLPRIVARGFVSEEVVKFTTTGRDIDARRYKPHFWVHFLVGVSREKDSPLPEFEAFDPSCRVYPAVADWQDDGTSRDVPIDEQRSDSASEFLNGKMAKIFSSTFWKIEGKPTYSPSRCLEFQIPDIAVATVTVCRWLLSQKFADRERRSNDRNGNEVKDEATLSTGSSDEGSRDFGDGTTSAQRELANFPEFFERQKVQPAVAELVLRLIREIANPTGISQTDLAKQVAKETGRKATSIIAEARKAHWKKFWNPDGTVWDKSRDEYERQRANSASSRELSGK